MKTTNKPIVIQRYFGVMTWLARTFFSKRKINPMRWKMDKPIVIKYVMAPSLEMEKRSVVIKISNTELEKAAITEPIQPMRRLKNNRQEETRESKPSRNSQ